MQGKWQKLVDNFQTEIKVLIDAPIDEISKIDSNIAPAVEAFRNNSIDVIPGGGGKYGEISFENKLEKPKAAKITTLDNF